MGRKILSFIITLAVVLAALPVNIKAAETGQPTRIQEQVLILSNEAAGNENEGWKWTQNAEGGGTLKLENCYIRSGTTGVLNFDHLTEENSTINIVLRGKNILETTSTIFNSMVSAYATGNINGSYIITGDEDASLELRSAQPIESDSSPYGFAGKSIEIQSGNIKSNVAFCTIKEDFSMQSGSLTVHTPKEATNIDGIYTDNGSVNINGGIIDIDVSRIGIFIPGIGPDKGYNQKVNISGGDININAGYVGVFVNPNNKDVSDNNEFINITGGNLNCYGEQIGLYAKDISIVGENTIPQVNVLNGTASTHPVIRPVSGSIVIFGSAVIATGPISGYSGDGNEKSVIKNSIIFDGTGGKVHGEAEVTKDLEIPADSTLSVPEGSTLVISEGTTLTVPEGSSLAIDKGAVENNGVLILPEENTGITCTGTGHIKKGDNLYTNNNERLYLVKIKKQDGNESQEYYKEKDTVEIVPETAPEGQRFKEWKVIPETLKIENNQFTMPAEDVVIEAVYEKIPVVTEPPAPSPSGSTKPAVTPAPTASTIPPEGTVTPAPPVNTKTPVPVRTSPPVSQPPYYIPSAKKHVTIRIMANPAEGGTVTGAVEAEEGDTVTVKAATNTGYTFAGWRENGQQVCADAIYTFKAEENRELIAVFKKDTPAATNTPANTINDKINVTNNIKTVAYVPLPDGWSWDKEDSIKEIPAGGSVTAAAYYNAGMPGNITNNPVIITITRDKCEEDPKVLYTGNDEYAPGCTTDGCGHTECSLCGSVINSGIKVPATGHTESTPLITKAAKGKDGSIIINCTKCGTILNKTVINAVQSVKLSKKSVTYNKKVQRPVITVKDSKGNILGNGTDYTVSFAKGMKKAGIYNIKIIFTGKYQDTINKTYKIVPEGTSVAKTMQKKKGFLIKWKKQAEQVTGYQLQYSTSKKFTSKTTVKKTIKDKKITSKFISGLETGKKYYVRIRTYKNVKAGKNTVKVFSGWSACKNFQVN